MSQLGIPLAVTFLAHALIVLAFGIRIVMRRSAPGVAFAWLLLIVILPLAGAVLYLLIGERRVGPERARRLDSLVAAVRDADAILPGLMHTDVDWSRHTRVAANLDRLGRNLCGFATVVGSELELFANSGRILEAIARDVDGARSGVTMIFYIWCEGGSADVVADALVRAAGRGVTCRVLVDAIGARPWLAGDQPRRLRAAGVRVEAALPVGPVRSFVSEAGLRLHRKVVVVDDAVAWTGSMNLADPRIFKRDAGVGEWFDAMVRVTGAAVAPLAMTAFGDWMLETGDSIRETAVSGGLTAVAPRGPADVQVVPSGPGESGDGLLLMLLTLLAATREEVVITTPYLVPDESMMRALRTVAGRGARVAIVIPEHVDSFLTRHASRSFFDDLLDSGVEIHLYRKGLLHTKSIVVDREIAMFGSVNLDMRSLWINYEIALFVYHAPFAETLGALQRTYLADSRRLDPTAWAARPLHRRLAENAIRLVSPIL